MNIFSTVQADSEAGIAILYTVIVSAVVIMLGASITSIVLREFELVISSESSTRAFYAADTALECAMYEDRKNSASSTFPGAPSESSTINCAGDTVTVTESPSGTYSFTLDDNNGSANICADVTVEKNASDDTPTKIEARGFNTCVSSDRQAERALRSSY